MNRADKEPIKDAAKRRREYVRIKVTAKALAGIFGATAFGSCLLTGCAFLLLLLMIMTLPIWYSYTAAYALLCFLILCALGTLTFVTGRLSSQYMDKARLTPYVPPVRDQIAALPADEILLRGADEPLTRPDGLLRAAHARSETASEELLRPTRANFGKG